MSQCILTCLSVVTALATHPAAARDQPDATTVRSQATATIARPAEFLRVQVDLIAKHKDAPQAVAALKKLKEAAVAKVGALGALPDTVKFAEPTLGGVGGVGPSAESRRLMLMRAPGPLDEQKTAGQPVWASVRLSADWPLTGAGEDLLLAIHELQGKIRAADVAGVKAAPPKPDEEEAEEESEEAPHGQPKPGELTFAYIIKLKPAELAQADADAFAKARSLAERYARAAGLTLGKLKALGFDRSSSRPDYAYLEDIGIDPSDILNDENTEVLGVWPTRIEHTVSVRADFEAVP